MKHALLILLALALVLTCLSCSLLGGKKTGIAHSRWTCSSKTFVADAGTETTTYTLEFISGNEYVLKRVSSLPSHPAMYMNPDGTVDTIPGRTTEHDSRGIYRVQRGEVILIDAEGATHRLRPASGTLESKDLSFEPLVFSREEKAEAK